MSIEGLAAKASLQNYGSMYAVIKGMDLQQTQQQQLLASLPPAPSAEPHKGQNVNVFA